MLKDEEGLKSRTVRGRWWACMSYDNDFAEFLQSKSFAISGYAVRHDRDYASDGSDDDISHDAAHVAKSGLVMPHWHAMIDTGRGSKYTKARLLSILGKGRAYNDFFMQVNPSYYGPYLIHMGLEANDTTDMPKHKVQYSVKDVVAFGSVQPYEQFLEGVMRDRGPQIPFADFVHLCEFGDIHNFRELAHVLRRRYPHWLGAFAELDMRQQALLERILKGDCRSSQRVLWEGYDLFPFAVESEEEQAALDALREQQQIVFD